MDPIKKALWCIESRFAAPLSLDEIAEVSGVSRFHLVRAFGVATGRSVMRYVRERRLTEAARQLANGAPDILSVALDWGYGSHEAFTRAFREQFGTTPERVREARSTGHLDLVAALDLPARGGAPLDPPRLVDRPALRAVGLVRRHAFDAVVGIPAQWQAFVERMHWIPHRVEAMPIGLAYPAGDDGRFDYASACEVSASGRRPADMADIALEPRRYAVFEHRAHVSSIFDTYAAIWNHALPAHGWHPADAPAIEHHHPAFDPGTGEGGLSLWIPLADGPDPPATADAPAEAVAR